ncbi:MAG: energy coupling factor transporter S component ThiW [Synergistaceae bacterium]
MSIKESKILRKTVLCGILSSIGVILSVVSIPLGPTKCYPFQHTINVISGILLGPFWAIGTAFTTSLIRNMLGTGSLFAFPGSMFGAFFVGLVSLFLPQNRKIYSAIAEPIGTGLVGAWVSSLIIAPILGTNVAFSFLSTSFLVSSIPGTILGILVTYTLVKRTTLTDSFI